MGGVGTTSGIVKKENRFERYANFYECIFSVIFGTATRQRLQRVNSHRNENMKYLVVITRRYCGLAQTVPVDQHVKE
jgi:hypothetical protein